MTLETYQHTLSIYLAYMQLKITQKDWHGVADAAMDLRELETEYQVSHS